MQCNLNQTCILIIDGCAVKNVEDFLRFKSSLSMFSKYKFLPPIEIELPPSWCTDNGKCLIEFQTFLSIYFCCKYLFVLKLFWS